MDTGTGTVPQAGSEIGRRTAYFAAPSTHYHLDSCYPLRALPILPRAFPFDRKINRGGDRCNGELTSVDSEQKDKTHLMNNGWPVAHYTGERSRAVLYVKTWTIGRPRAGRTIARHSFRAAKAPQVPRRKRH